MKTNDSTINAVLAYHLVELAKGLIGKAERSEVLQGCPPSPMGSAPERSGGAETSGDYLSRSAPVKWSEAEWKRRDDYRVKLYKAAVQYSDFVQSGNHDFKTAMRVADELEQAAVDFQENASDSGRRSAPKTESVAKPRRRSGAQARNDESCGASDASAATTC